jgi:hypothetical protein
MARFSMKFVFLFPLLPWRLGSNCFAQERIYRCGNEYTNTVPESQVHNCKLVSGGNVTVVQAHRPSAQAQSRQRQSTARGVPVARVDSADQRAKDSDTRLILDSELKKAEARQAELLKEYNNGEPEKQGPEAPQPPEVPRSYYRAEGQYCPERERYCGHSS